jgi:hypothetical protein
LQIQLHLSLSLEAGYLTGEKPVSAEPVESVLSPQLVADRLHFDVAQTAGLQKT